MCPVHWSTMCTMTAPKCTGAQINSRVEHKGKRVPQSPPPRQTHTPFLSRNIGTHVCCAIRPCSQGQLSSFSELNRKFVKKEQRKHENMEKQLKKNIFLGGGKKGGNIYCLNIGLTTPSAPILVHSCKKLCKSTSIIVVSPDIPGELRPGGQ